MYQLCVRNTECNTEMIFNFSDGEMRSLTELINILEQRSDEYLNYEIIYK